MSISKLTCLSLGVLGFVNSTPLKPVGRRQDSSIETHALPNFALPASEELSRDLKRDNFTTYKVASRNLQQQDQRDSFFDRLSNAKIPALLLGLGVLGYGGKKVMDNNNADQARVSPEREPGNITGNPGVVVVGRTRTRSGN